MISENLAKNSNAWAKHSVAMRWALFLLTLLALSATTCFAQQVSATLFGTVTDPAGAVIPDAKITARNPANGRTTTATTQADGGYVFPYLEPADYTITVEKTGFDKYEQTRLTLVVNQKSRLDIQLKVGTVATTVEACRSTPGASAACPS